MERHLAIELVPSSSWYDNVRSRVTRAEWDRIRRKVYAEYGHECGICHAKGRLAAHELWEYDDESRSQRLTGMIALCDLCHHVKHIGFAEVLASQGRLDIKRVVAHYCRVNGCTAQEFMQDRNAAFSLWSARSEHPWDVDVSKLAEYTAK